MDSDDEIVDELFARYSRERDAEVDAWLESEGRLGEQDEIREFLAVEKRFEAFAESREDEVDDAFPELRQQQAAVVRDVHRRRHEREQAASSVWDTLRSLLRLPAFQLTGALAAVAIVFAVMRHDPRDPEFASVSLQFAVMTKARGSNSAPIVAPNAAPLLTFGLQGEDISVVVSNKVHMQGRLLAVTASNLSFRADSTNAALAASITGTISGSNLRPDAPQEAYGLSGVSNLVIEAEYVIDGQVLPVKLGSKPNP